MSDELQEERGRAVELLELRDRLDLLDQELRERKTGLVVVPLVVTLLAAPLLILLVVNEAPFLVAYMSTLFIVGGAIIYGMTIERRRLGEERETIRHRIRQIEDAP